MIKKSIFLTLALLVIASLLNGCKETENEKSQNVYTCPMHPQVIQSEPGSCPICGMDLVKQGDENNEADSSANHDNQFALGATALINANVMTHMAVVGSLDIKRRFSAHVDFNEGPRYLVSISTKYEGWVEALKVTREGQYVKKGQPLFALYSPEILAAKEEYLATYKAVSSAYNAGTDEVLSAEDNPTLKAAKRKLLYLDVPAAQITQIEKNLEAPRISWFYSPLSGVVIKKDLLQGAHIKAGQEVLRLANLSQVWVITHIFEKDLPFVKQGQKVKVKVRGYPGEVFEGRIDLIYPYLDKKTRDIKVRVVLPNHAGKLKPGMFAEVTINSSLKQKTVLIPETAVIYSGEKNYVFVSLGNRHFEVRAVDVLATSNGQAAISGGLKEQELVVVNGQFLLDSESSLKENLKMSQEHQKSEGNDEHNH